MTVKVVDASVAAAILFVETQADQALSMISGSQLIAPLLLPFELAHVAVKKSRRDPENAKRIHLGLGQFLRLGIALRPVKIEAVAELALSMSLSGYDAAYLWLAQVEEAELVSFDQKLSRAAGR